MAVGNNNVLGFHSNCSSCCLVLYSARFTHEKALWSLASFVVMHQLSQRQSCVSSKQEAAGSWSNRASWSFTEQKREREKPRRPFFFFPPKGLKIWSGCCSAHFDPQTLNGKEKRKASLLSMYLSSSSSFSWNATFCAHFCVPLKSNESQSNALNNISRNFKERRKKHKRFNFVRKNNFFSWHNYLPLVQMHVLHYM